MSRPEEHGEARAQRRRRSAGASASRYSFDELLALVEQLRNPGGCPWDRKQTHESLRPHLLEESYELLEAIDADDAEGIAEELGDLLVQVAFHSDMGRRAGTFTAHDVLELAYQKLVRRHPHVFGGGQRLENADQVAERWEEIKRREGKKRRVAEAIPGAMPALAYAAGIQQRAERGGIDWHAGNDQRKESEILEGLRDRLEGLEEPGAREEALGRFLFEVVKESRDLKIDPETALRRAAQAFRDRIGRVEDAAGEPLSEVDEKERTRLWRESSGDDSG